VIVQAEGKKAVENLDEIMEVEGIDIIFVGPYDLSSSLGIIGQINHPRVMECIQDICDRANAKGIKVGCFADNVHSAKKLREMGVKFLGYSCDTAIFHNAAAADVAEYLKGMEE
jgi:4-hydroxy-2-oxoheptanedioate aldolase